MKLTLQQSRKGLAKHNDRTGKTGKHIDKDKTCENKTWQVHPGLTFEEEERLFYREKFGEWLEERNERAIAARHPERVKTIDDLLRARQTRPEEVILQIGKEESHADPKTLWKASRRFIAAMEYKYPLMRTLDYAMHVDETTPHLHHRRVWTYHDESGNLAIGQEKSLEEMGVSLPYPDRPRGRYNNRKITFTEDARQTWVKICRELGLSIEDPEPCSRKHEDKLQHELQEAREELQEARKQLKAINSRLEDVTKRYEALRNDCKYMMDVLGMAQKKEREYAWLKEDQDVMAAVGAALDRLNEQQSYDDFEDDFGEL